MKREDLEKLAAEGGSVRVEAKAYLEQQDALAQAQAALLSAAKRGWLGMLWRGLTVGVGALAVFGTMSVGIGVCCGLVAWGYNLVAP